MKESRYKELFNNADAELTPEETKEGWHFCPEWDFLLIGVNMPELECCTCTEGNNK